MLPSELAARKFAETCASCGGAEQVLRARSRAAQPPAQLRGRAWEPSQGFHFVDPCPACSGTGYSRLRCRSCFTWKVVGEFLRAGRLVRRCSGCREGAPAGRGPIAGTGPLLVKWSPASHNRKTGCMPVSMTSPRTCPVACPWRGAGCYGEQYFAGVHWRRLDEGRGMSWADFCARVAALPAGQPWRHNEAGDLPGDGNAIDPGLLFELAEAARHTRGFTYIHKPVLGDHAISAANRAYLEEARFRVRSRGDVGLVVNLSTDGLPHADQLCDLGLAPVVVVLPGGGPRARRTPAGRRVVTCPALHDETTSCLTCMICAREDRDFLVGFPAHGFLRKKMSERLTQLRLF